MMPNRPQVSWSRRGATLLLLALAAGRPALAQNSDSATSPTAPAGWQEGLDLPPLLRALPPSTSFFFSYGPFHMLRREFGSRIGERHFKEGAALHQWHAVGRTPAMRLAGELLGLDLARLYQTLAGDGLVGRANTPDGPIWFAQVKRLGNDQSYEKAIRQTLFARMGLTHIDQAGDYLFGASSRRALATIQTLRAFPRTHYSAMPLHQALKAAGVEVDGRDVYSFWLELDGSSVWGHARWESLGLHHYAEIMEADKDGTFGGLLAENDGGFESFNWLPPAPLTASAARFRSTRAVYDALTDPTHALYLGERLVQRLKQFERQGGGGVRGGLLDHLGGEWCYSTWRARGVHTPWLCLVETRNIQAVERFAERFARGLGQPLTSSVREGRTVREWIFYGRRIYLTAFDSFLAIANDAALLDQAAQARREKRTFRSSAAYAAAVKRLTGDGVAYSFYHTLACLNQQAAQTLQLPLHQEGLLHHPMPALDPKMPVDARQLTQDMSSRMDLIGCARIQRSQRGLTLDCYSATGLGPVEATLTSQFGPFLHTRLSARVIHAQQTLKRFAEAVAAYYQTHREPLKVTGFAIDPLKQLNLPTSAAAIDPFSKEGLPFVFYAADGVWVVAGRGPDADIDLQLPEDLEPKAKNPLGKAANKLYLSKRGLASNGDMCRYGYYQER